MTPGIGLFEASFGFFWAGMCLGTVLHFGHGAIRRRSS